MDPHKAWSDLSFAVARNDSVRAAEIAGDFIVWLRKAAYRPRSAEQQVFDRVVGANTCEAVSAWELAS